MNLEILSFNEAIKYVPKEKTYVIRIFDSIPMTPILDLTENDNWVKINKYFFNDGWPKNWKEYSWIDRNEPHFNGLLDDLSWDELQDMYPKMTKESLIGYFESLGYPNSRGELFNEIFAKQILNDFETFGKGVENIIIHCSRGQNRSPAIGIAMNEIYSWGIKGLKEKFPWYRRYIYDVMVRVSKI